MCFGGQSGPCAAPWWVWKWFEMPLFDVVALCAQVPGGAVGMRGHNGGKPQAGGDGKVFKSLTTAQAKKDVAKLGQDVLQARALNFFAKPVGSSGKGKIRKFGNFVGREQNPSSILRGGKPFFSYKISIFFVI